MANTKIVLNTKVKKLWDFPELAVGGNSRIFTKHYINLTYCLDPNCLSLLSFLIYKSDIDNTIIYSSATLEQYKLAVKHSQIRYGANTHLLTSLPNTRKYFIYLVENGLILPVNAKVFLINPRLTYHKLYVKTIFYKEWCLRKSDISIMVDKWIENFNKINCK